jgi:hypothetical protein
MWLCRLTGGIFPERRIFRSSTKSCPEMLWHWKEDKIQISAHNSPIKLIFYLENVHFRAAVALRRFVADDEDEDVVVHLHGVVAGEGGRLLDERHGEFLHDGARLVVHDHDPRALEPHLHLLRPDAVGLFQLQQAPHAVGRVNDACVFGHGEGGQVLHDVGGP